MKGDSLFQLVIYHQVLNWFFGVVWSLFWDACKNETEKPLPANILFPNDHTEENIALGLREALAAWDLCEARQVAIATDNGTNIVKAVELNQWTRIQCFGHRLHLAIGKLNWFHLLLLGYSKYFKLLYI